MKRIVVVGGGAGGLELVTKLGEKLGRKKKARITLIDQSPTHLWKPLLHEVAVGAMDEGIDAVSYRAHAREHGYYFNIGRMTNIDREKKQVILAAMFDQQGQELLPETRVDYDILVMALGSTSNDFGTPGVKQHCIFLDQASQAHYFRDQLLNQFIRLQRLPETSQSVKIAIVGAGATGVELSAELRHAYEEVHRYGFDVLTPEKLQISLIEAGPRILGGLPERISKAAHKELEKLGVSVHVNTMISEATPQGLKAKGDHFFEADIKVWAAGIKVADFMKNIGGLETNRIHQLIVNDHLQTESDSHVFAIGDCAAFTQKDGSLVPPRAQSAHQMAEVCYKNILSLLNDKPLKTFKYQDHGSLVSLSGYSTVGNLMGNLAKGSLFIEGKIARIMYISLYRLHQLAIHGWIKTGLLLLAGRMHKWLKPKIKLH